MILIVAFFVGATGSIYYNVVAAPKRYEATAQLQTQTLTFTILSDPKSDPRRALQSLVMTTSRIESLSGRSWEINDPSIRPVEDFSWKNVVFAGIVGILVAIGAIYVIEEGQERQAPE